jgi:hypothetical protein
MPSKYPALTMLQELLLKRPLSYIDTDSVIDLAIDLGGVLTTLAGVVLVLG